MSRQRPAGSFWPSGRQELLLVAALGEAPAAPAAWQELRPELDLQTLEDSSFAALPLVYRMLDTAGVEDPELPRLKGIYRSTWVKNNMLVERLRTTAEAFRTAEVPLLVVGSIGAALRYYPALGLRPTAHVELLVREDDAIRAVPALGSSGWSTRGAAREGPAAPLALFDREGGICLLRTALAPDFALGTREAAHAALWEAATEIDAHGLPVRALCPTDDLLAAIVTGARAKPAASIQWIIDAAMILRAAPEQVDWERLWEVGVERGQGLRLRDALEYLRRLVGVAPPAAVQERLGGRTPSARERLTHACTARTVPGLGSLPQALGEHLASTAGRSAWATAAALPGFFRERWQLEHTWQLPIAGGRRAYRNLVRNRG